MLNKKNLWTGALVFGVALIGIWKYTESQTEVRKITPPKLDTVHLGKKILCHRPMRHGSPALNLTKVSDKLIANNYGHGGSGWTLGP